MMVVDNHLTKQEKNTHTERGIGSKITPGMKKGGDTMCNLSEGIEHRGSEKGRAE